MQKLKEIWLGFLGVCRSVFDKTATGRKQAMFLIPLVVGVLCSFVMGVAGVLFTLFALVTLMELAYVFLSEKECCLKGFCLVLPDWNTIRQLSFRQMFNIARGDYDQTDAYYSYSAIFIVLVFKIALNIF